MAISFLENKSLHASATAKEFTDMVIEVVYPMLFEHIYELMERIVLLNETGQMEMMQSQLNLVTLALTAMRQKEKAELFPLILQLDLEQRQSGTCKPFKDTKTYYIKLLAFYQELKKSIDTYAQLENADDNLELISDSVYMLEKYIIGVQIMKEKHLFAKYKSCTGCKSLEDVK